MITSTLQATVFIPTYNGEKYIEEIIHAVFSQSVDIKYELLIIDSGSTDETLEIIEKCQKIYPALRLHKIPNSEYGHGKTRNLAAEMARGEIVVYLSHDATPAHDTWLYEILKPFQINKKIVAVMGTQNPRAHCIPMLKYEIRSVFRNFGPHFGTTIFYKDDFIEDQATYDATRFYSDVNSAARREFLVDVVPYRDVKYAEDQLFGEDVIEAGYYKAFAPRAAVIHSNDLKLTEYAKRIFDETYGLRKSGYGMDLPSLPLTIKMITLGSLKDTLRIARDPNYSVKRKTYWLALNPWFHVEKWRGVRRALKAPLNGTTTHLSLEESRKKLK